jgi:hypothetical protein
MSTVSKKYEGPAINDLRVDERQNRASELTRSFVHDLVNKHPSAYLLNRDHSLSGLRGNAKT